MNQYYLIFVLTALVSTKVYSQQDPINTQYLFNPLVYNPSYAGINNITNITLNSRYQWTSLEGSPTTYSLTANSSIVNGKVGIGLMLLRDKIGVSENTEVQLSYAYKINSGSKVFSFGLQTGVVSYTKKFNILTLRVDDDPFFQPNVEESTKFNIGTGISYMTDKFIISFSVPRLINSKVGNGADVVAHDRHYYLMGAYIIELKSGLKIKPSVLIRGVSGATPSIDANFSFFLINQLWAGAFTRNFSTYGLMAQYDFMDAYKIGYSYEILGNNFSGNALPTHEIILSADFAIFSHQSVFKRFF